MMVQNLLLSQVMRKNLLKLVHVREFSAEAAFEDPCRSFTLPNVICRYQMTWTCAPGIHPFTILHGLCCGFYDKLCCIALAGG